MRQREYCDRVARIVAEHHGWSLSELLSRRPYEPTIARHMVAVLINETAPSIPQTIIADALHRDRSTVAHGLEEIKRLEQQDAHIRNTLAWLRVAVRSVCDS